MMGLRALRFDCLGWLGLGGCWGEGLEVPREGRRREGEVAGDLNEVERTWRLLFGDADWTWRRSY